VDDVKVYSMVALMVARKRWRKRPRDRRRRELNRYRVTQPSGRFGSFFWSTCHVSADGSPATGGLLLNRKEWNRQSRLDRFDQWMDTFYGEGSEQ
jgi:hypothetical protein